MKLDLRALNPETERHLFEESYRWRGNKKTNALRPDRMSFETFSASDPSQVVMGLFNGSLCAIYVIHHNSDGTVGTHYTSKRGTPKEYVLAGARWLLRWLLENGALEVQAFVSPKNKPLCRFVEDIGYSQVGLVKFPLQSTEDSDTLPTREYVYYAAKGGPP